jgi:signal transduction histidine kinase
LGSVVGFDVQVTFVGPVDTAVSEVVAEHLLATIREAVTNVGRHAGASQATVHIEVESGMCTLTVRDNGIGIGEQTGGGLGLTNLRRRAEKLGGTFVIETGKAGGATLTWQVPLLA